MNAPLPAETADLVLSAMQREMVAAETFHVRRLAALAEAIRLRREFFWLAGKLRTNPWTYCQRIFPDGRSGDEELALIRENWIEAMKGMNRHVY